MFPFMEDARAAGALRGLRTGSGGYPGLRMRKGHEERHGERFRDGRGGEASPDAVRFLPYRTGTEKRFFRKSAADAV